MQRDVSLRVGILQRFCLGSQLQVGHPSFSLRSCLRSRAISATRAPDEAQRNGTQRLTGFSDLNAAPKIAFALFVRKSEHPASGLLLLPDPYPLSDVSFETTVCYGPVQQRLQRRQLAVVDRFGRDPARQDVSFHLNHIRLRERRGRGLFTLAVSARCRVAAAI